MEGQIICQSTNRQFVGQIICQTTNGLSKDKFLEPDKGGWVAGGEWGQRLLNRYDYQTEFGLIKSPVFAPTDQLKCIILPKLFLISVRTWKTVSCMKTGSRSKEIFNGKIMF